MHLAVYVCASLSMYVYVQACARMCVYVYINFEPVWKCLLDPQFRNFLVQYQSFASANQTTIEIADFGAKCVDLSAISI